MINYRRLLAQYVDHVSREEGSTFLAEHNRTDHFTDAQWAALKAAESGPTMPNPPDEPDDDGPFWRVIMTDTEQPSGVAPICPEQGDVNKHSTGDGYGVEVDEQGVYDCCPGPHIECWSEDAATRLAAMLNHGHVRLCD